MEQNTFPVFVELGVPAVSGLSVAEAPERISMAGFVEGGDLGRFEWVSSWSVVGTDPAEGAPLPIGERVNLLLQVEDSLGEPPTFDSRIPDVGGLDVDAAALLLQGLGYTTSFVAAGDQSAQDVFVASTGPSAGTFLPPPGNVQLNISAGPVAGSRAGSPCW